MLPSVEKYTVNVVIIEDDETIRNGYAYLISSKPGYNVVNTYGSAEEALKKISNDHPDIILLDIGLPGISGVDAIPKFKNTLPQAHILILTVYESENIIFTALSNGASGYITKNTTAEKIINAIGEVMEGGGPMSINIARMVVKSFQKNQNSPLSKRETQVLDEIANGKNRSRIAEEFFIDVETVKTHIKNIYFKLNVNCRAEAIQKAKANKFI